VICFFDPGLHEAKYKAAKAPGSRLFDFHYMRHCTP
jgi:hypothetical protein